MLQYLDFVKDSLCCGNRICPQFLFFCIPYIICFFLSHALWELRVLYSPMDCVLLGDLSKIDPYQ